MNIIKEFIKLQIGDKKWHYKLNEMKKDKEKKILLIGTPIHGNLGDHAIALEEKNFLNFYFSEYKFYEITMPMYNIFKKRLQKNISKKDLIFISGGGWMGNLWLHNENVIREIVSSYPNNQIIIFPQTVFYSNDDKGMVECKKTAEILNRHSNLFLFLREKDSYNLAKKYFSEININLAPDMALYGSLLKDKQSSVVSNTIKVCLRNDREQVLDIKEEVLNILGEKYKKYKIEEITTVLPKYISLNNRKKEVLNCWRNISEAKILITDRLHAMIFSVLNGVPCIVLNNKTGKVFGVYSWIKNESIVSCVSTVDEILMSLQNKITENHKEFNRKKLLGEYDTIANKIKEGIK